MAQISKITLPSGTTYDIKDSIARSLISSGITFIIAWDGSSNPVAQNIPEGLVVTYDDIPTTGTLAATDGITGAFYLIKSSSSSLDDSFNFYEEYVVIKPDINDNTTWFWEKIGDTKINLTNVVTNVQLNKTTDSVIGSDSTFTITQPTINLISNSNSTFNSITYVQEQGEIVTADLLATASGGSTSWNSKDSKTVVTGYTDPTTDTFIKNITPTVSKLTTTIITGVDGSTSASKATPTTSQTTISGFSDSTNNADFLADISISNETLTIRAKRLDTQTTTQFTFSDVVVPQAANSSTTVATGSVATGSSGASIVTGVEVSSSANAITQLGTPSTENVIGTNATFTNVQPTVTLTTGVDGDVTVATGIGTATTKYLSATASDANTEWNSKDTVTVLTDSSSLTVTKGS